MTQREDLLFELGTEELPPKVLKKLALSLLSYVENGLKDIGVGYANAKFYASPRRIGFLITQVELEQKDMLIDKEGPFLAHALDADGQPTKAALGFAKSCGVEYKDLKTVSHKKGQRLFYQVKEKGMQTSSLLPEIVSNGLKKLPVPKMMRWGDSPYQFVRPVHWVLFLLGEKVIEASFYGRKASNVSYGHRFHQPQAITVKQAVAYERLLKEKGHILVDWQERKQALIDQAEALAAQKKATMLLDDELVEEVNAIVEWPNALCCDFDKDFLRVPQEALISAMQEHQKCFALLDQQGRIINHFITVSNIESKCSQTVISGNNKVMAARLSDAAFFYDTDGKHSLEYFVEKLKMVTFQKQLGSLFERSQRLSKLCGAIGVEISANQSLCQRAGFLAKADLMSDIVYEFTDLQGIIGKYYAIEKGEDISVCDALEMQYWPKFSGDQLPKNEVAIALSLAEKLDTLVGIFGIGQKPTGDKDPFALRRAAIGVLRILKEKSIDIPLNKLIALSVQTYENKLACEVEAPLLQFFIDRLRVIYKDEHVSSDAFESVLAVCPASVVDFNQRILAVLAFQQSSESARLAQSNKRVANILHKNNVNDEIKINPELFVNDYEKSLNQALSNSEGQIQSLLKARNYKQTLVELGKLDQPVDAFFEHVLVMDEDEALKNNRIALLQKLYRSFKEVADIAKL